MVVKQNPGANQPLDKKKNTLTFRRRVGLGLGTAAVIGAASLLPDRKVGEGTAPITTQPAPEELPDHTVLLEAPDTTPISTLPSTVKKISPKETRPSSAPAEEKAQKIELINHTLILHLTPKEFRNRFVDNNERYSVTPNVYADGIAIPQTETITDKDGKEKEVEIGVLNNGAQIVKNGKPVNVKEIVVQLAKDPDDPIFDRLAGISIVYASQDGVTPLNQQKIDILCGLIYRLEAMQTVLDPKTYDNPEANPLENPSSVSLKTLARAASEMVSFSLGDITAQGLSNILPTSINGKWNEEDNRVRGSDIVKSRIQLRLDNKTRYVATERFLSFLDIPRVQAQINEIDDECRTTPDNAYFNLLSHPRFDNLGLPTSIPKAVGLISDLAHFVAEELDMEGPSVPTTGKGQSR